MLDIRIDGLSPDPVPYRQAWARQRRLHAEIAADRRPDTLLLLEHEECFTAGRRTRPEERPRDGSEVIDVDRGGKITWHGPGQLVGYPLIRLPEPVDVLAHVRTLEHALIDALAHHGVDGRLVDGRSGVWVRHQGADAKIAAIGVRVEKGVSMHGFALNCDNTLDGFAKIVPCGIRDAAVTTIAQVTGAPASPRDLLDTVVSAMRHHLDTVLVA